jgi:type III secretory pathway component EscR
MHFFTLIYAWTQNLDGQTDRWTWFLYTPSLCLWEYNNRWTSSICIYVFLDFLHVELVIFFITLSHGRYLVCVIWNSKSVQLILFNLCTVFIYILKMFTCYYIPTSKDWGYKGITSICLSNYLNTFWVSDYIY